MPVVLTAVRGEWGRDQDMGRVSPTKSQFIITCVSQWSSGGDTEWSHFLLIVVEKEWNLFFYYSFINNHHFRSAKRKFYLVRSFFLYLTSKIRLPGRFSLFLAVFVSTLAFFFLWNKME